eukprot:1190011-Prorocentrum_minimum.AAC.1
MKISSSTTAPSTSCAPPSRSSSKVPMAARQRPNVARANGEMDSACYIYTTAPPLNESTH